MRIILWEGYFWLADEGFFDDVVFGIRIGTFFKAKTFEDNFDICVEAHRAANHRTVRIS